ncbi:carbamoyltransferase, partial [bacterium]|nr:carbamoyltransferase [bacterium]
MKCLGLNFSLDAAAAIVVDGRVVAAACQERFDRVKHSAAYPQDAIWACLHEAGLSIRDLDQVAVSWNPAHHLAVPNRLRETIYRDHREYLETIPARLIDAGGLRPEGATRLSIPSDDGSLDVVFYDHHLCHAAGAYTMSGFEEASFLTADGYGETRSTTWGTGDRGGLQTFGSVDFPHSLGAVYAAVTSFLGFRANNGEGKVMALAG